MQMAVSTTPGQASRHSALRHPDPPLGPSLASPWRRGDRHNVCMRCATGLRTLLFESPQPSCSLTRLARCGRGLLRNQAARGGRLAGRPTAMMSPILCSPVAVRSTLRTHHPWAESVRQSHSRTDVSAYATPVSSVLLSCSLAMGGEGLRSGGVPGNKQASSESLR